MKETIMEEYEILKRFIEEDIAERDFGHGNIGEFDPQKIIDDETVEVYSENFGPKHNRVGILIGDDVKKDKLLDQYIINFLDKEITISYFEA